MQYDVCAHEYVSQWVCIGLPSYGPLTFIDFAQEVLARHPDQVGHRGGPVGQVLQHLGADHQVEATPARPGLGGQSLSGM